MSTLGYSSIKCTSTAKENEEKREDAREKAMLLFAFQLLVDKGYIATASSFASECSLDLGQYAMCENIDLRLIFVEFEAYHNIKFQRYPQYFRKSSGQTNGENLLQAFKNKSTRPPSKSRTNARRAQLETEDNHGSDEDPFASIKPTVTQFQASNSPNTDVNGKLLKPISGLEFANDDMRIFAGMIQNDIITTDLGVKWSDVVGLENAKMILMESLVYSKEFTDFFGNAFPPWRGLLLYGPPGNGKTLLAKAVASETKTSFFNISSSTIVSKWRGDSEKLVRVLFDLAKYHAPSTIFFDEFDALGLSRDSGGESDASRRLKSELLQQLDGLLSQNCSSNDGLPVFVLAATNMPWDLDPAILRRLEKRIYVPLPNAGERLEILQTYFGKAIERVVEGSKGKNEIIAKIDFKIPASVTEGYSASDLHHIVKECIVRKFRRQYSCKIKKLTVETNDVVETIEAVPPTVHLQLQEKFEKWNARFGAY